METTKFVSFTPEGFKIFLLALKDSFGTAGQAMIYDMSKRYGEYMIQQLIDPDYLEEHDLETIVSHNLQGVQRMGWGRFTGITMDALKGRYEIEFQNTLFEDFCEKDDSSPPCLFVKGVLAGTITALTHSEVHIKEITCRGENGSNCKFIFERI